MNGQANTEYKSAQPPTFADLVDMCVKFTNKSPAYIHPTLGAFYDVVVQVSKAVPSTHYVIVAETEPVIEVRETPKRTGRAIMYVPAGAL